MPKILVIDDEKDVLDDVVALLELEQFVVLAADNGVKGIKAALEHRPDLILCDIMMPEMNGYEVLFHLRSEPATALIPFIFLSALTARHDVRHGMELGADDYLTKPFTIEALLKSIQTRLKKHEETETAYLRKLESIRYSLVTTLPHEIRTPLASILGYAEMLTTEDASDFVHRAAENILKAGQRLHRLSENYLLYIQLEMLLDDPQQMQRMRQQILRHPSSFIEFTAVTTAERFHRSSDLMMDIDDAPVFIAEDSLTKIVDELVDNACKFSRHGMSVYITGKLKDQTYCLSVRDEGRGMSEEEINSIEAFRQFRRKSHEQQGGGMGLAIARAITEVYGGSLRVSSQPDAGTTVSIGLRSADEAPPQN